MDFIKFAQLTAVIWEINGERSSYRYSQLTNELSQHVKQMWIFKFANFSQEKKSG